MRKFFGVCVCFFLKKILFRYWFASDLFHAGSVVLFELIGVLLGLSICNGVILNVRFPTLLYELCSGVSLKHASAEELLKRLEEIDSGLAKVTTRLFFFF